MTLFKSLARTYRPNTFSELVGQETVVRSLTRGFETGVLTQAYLFSGERGVGKTTVARILAKAINCANGPTASPCQTCGPCTDITRGQSPDVLEMDAASHTSVDDIRNLQDGLRFAPLASRKRVTIIDEVHMLSTQAFNALLKTLEEPPPHLVFILATTEDHKIPDTVRSRCQHFRFRLLSVREIADHLGAIAGREGISVPVPVLAQLARSAQGSLRDALSLLDQVLRVGGSALTPAGLAELLGVTDQALEDRLLSSLLTGDLKGCLGAAAAALEAGVDPKSQIRSLATLLRDLLHSSIEEVPLTAPRYGWPEERVAALSPALPPNAFFLEQALSVLLHGEEDLRLSFQPSITFELLLARICHLKALLPLPEILAALRRERSISAAGPLPTSPPPRPGPSPSPVPTAPLSGRAPDSPATDPGLLDLRLPGDWSKALSRLPHDLKSMLEPARIVRFDHDTLILDTGNPFFNSRIDGNSIPLARAITEAVRSPHPLRIEVLSPTSRTEKSGAPVPPIVSEARAVFGSDVIGIRNPRTDPPKEGAS